MNIVTGEIAHPDANVDDAVNIGRQALIDFKAGWPDSFYEPLKKIIIPMDAKNKHISLGDHRVYDQELIYARAIGLLASSREIDFDDVLNYELAAYPPSMFSEEGKMRTAKSKSTLKKNLQVCISERNCPSPDVIIFDVSLRCGRSISLRVK